METKLWYKQPATNWNQALPIGNGRLGAMCFGGVARDLMQLNEESIWSGGFRNRNNPDCAKYMPAIRSLLKQGKTQEAEDLTRQAVTGTPEWQRCYQTLGNLHLHTRGHEPYTDYQRTLSLDNAVHTTQYTVGGITYRCEVFASAPDNVLVVRLSASQPGQISFDARISRERFSDGSGALDSRTVYFDGINGGADGIAFMAAMTGEASGGTLKTIGEFIVAEDADEVVLLISAESSFRGDNWRERCIHTLDTARGKGYAALLQNHLREYRRLFDRVCLALGEGSENLPTDERLRRFCENQDDNGLISLYFQYGRYLLISSSSPGALPANLQGIWCADFTPPVGQQVHHQYQH